MESEKYGGLRSVASTCQGTAISKMIARPLKGCSRFQVFARKNCWVRNK